MTRRATIQPYNNCPRLTYCNLTRMSDDTKHGSGGGAATFGGTNYQARVSAWIFSRMLAERPANPITHPIEARYVRFETSEPTDDILIGTSDGGHTFVQAKR